MQSPKSILLRHTEYISLYERLFAISRQANTALPFIPVIPEDWSSEDSKRIMWCGAATNGWGEDRALDEFSLIKECQKNDLAIKTHFANRNPKSSFWRVQKKCLRELNENWNGVIWNNVLKVGGRYGVAHGMPLGGHKKEQYDICLKAFQIEIATLQPQLVVLHVGELINDIREDIIGPWDNDSVIYSCDGKGLAAYKVHKGTRFIWMSRRSKKDEDYRQAFLTCLRALNWPPTLPHSLSRDTLAQISGD